MRPLFEAFRKCVLRQPGRLHAPEEREVDAAVVADPHLGVEIGLADDLDLQNVRRDQLAAPLRGGRRRQPDQQGNQQNASDDAQRFHVHRR